MCYQCAKLLYLPGYETVGTSFFPVSYENITGTDFYKPALTSAYDLALSAGHTVDYTVYTNMAMWAKWQNLSHVPETASSIINLIWADQAAGAVVGTKGVLGPGNAGDANQIVQIKVEPVVRKIKYHYLFAIPALLLAGICALIGFVALLSLTFRHANFATMRRHLHQTSAGRIYTALLYPEYCDMKTPAKEWSLKMGKNVLDLGEDSPQVTNIEVQAERKYAVMLGNGGSSDRINEQDGFLR